jgi:hypothetical protein
VKYCLAVARRSGIIYIVNLQQTDDCVIRPKAPCLSGIDTVRDGYMWVEWESAFQIEG